MDSLKYWESNARVATRRKNRTLFGFNEFFMVLLRLRLGLKEKDLAIHFKVCVNTLSYSVVKDLFHVHVPGLQGNTIVAMS